MKPSACCWQGLCLWNPRWPLTPEPEASGGGESPPRAVRQRGPIRAPGRTGTMKTSAHEESRVFQPPPDTAVTQNTEQFWKPWLKQFLLGSQGQQTNIKNSYWTNFPSSHLLKKSLFHKKSKGFLWGDREAGRREAKYFPSGTSWHPAFSSEMHQEEHDNHSKAHPRREWLA